ncbi:hypothetical protein RD792_014283 [Penstemon davidsonii]|uniref:RRM domain-containing protein n=1 Tax=Penstemon davidsonii TaxID=160366 RepID=A0ABR0CPT2_9LAMI|nr:hypothetical protein RD792_014283 [Penstemon davidsonii]
MSASSLSVAAAAIGTCSHSLSSTSLDFHHHISLRFYPNVAKPMTKTHSKINSNFLNYTPVLHLSRSLIHCVALDGVELNQEEEEGESGAAAEETVSEIEEEENEVSESVEGGRLYVGNLPFSLTSSQLSEIFAEAGTVVSVEYGDLVFAKRSVKENGVAFGDVFGFNVVYGRVTDRSRGFAFVTMGSVEEAKEAIRLFDGAQIGGRSAKVNFPEVPRGGEREVMKPRINQGFVDSPHKLYAGNLSWNLTSQNLREAFSEQPGFLSAKIIFDRDSGRSRGFGFITFQSAEDVETALNSMNGVELEGRPVRLNLAQQRDVSPPPEVGDSSESDVENVDVLSSVVT